MMKTERIKRNLLISIPFFLFSLGLFLYPADLARAQNKETPPREITKEFSLSQVIERVVDHFPALKSQDYALIASRHARQEALLGYFPKVSLGFAATRSNDPVYVFGSLLRQHKFTQDNFAVDALNEPSPYSNYGSSVEVSVPVFTGFQNEGKLRSAGLALKAAQSSRENTKQSAIFSAIADSIQILALNKTSALAQQTIALLKEAIREADNLKQKGMVLGCDYLTARAILSQVKNLQARIKYREASARSSLGILMGTAQGEAFDISPLDLPEVFPVVDSDSFRQESLNLRKDREALHYNIGLAESELRRERESWLPRIDAFVRGENNTNQFDEGANNYAAGLRVNMDILEPSLFPRLGRMQAEANRLKSDLKEIENTISDSLQQAVYEYQSQGEAAGLLKQSAEDARQAAYAIAGLYRAGKRTIADVVKAQSYALDAESSYWNARYDTYLGYVKLYYLCGKLDETNVNAVMMELSEKK